MLKLDKYATNKMGKEVCPFCGKHKEDMEFRNQISVKEWKISGLCQDCQDSVFGKD